jgi:hypothetical protein
MRLADSLAAPVTGKAGVDLAIPNLVAPDALLNLASDLNAYLGNVWGPLTIDFDFPLNLTNSLAKGLNAIFSL